MTKMKLFSVFLLLQFIVASAKVTEPRACLTKTLKTSELAGCRRQATTHALDLRGGGTSRFDGEVETRWLVHGDHDRDMKLLRSFTFVDKTGRRWTAPKGFDVDGASIPRPLWVTFGSPYVGDYRRASVVHDYFCKPEQHGQATSAEVHRMFYEAMLCDGVKRVTAWTMYQGVRVGGPRWNNK